MLVSGANTEYLNKLRAVLKVFIASKGRCSGWSDLVLARDGDYCGLLSAWPLPFEEGI